MTQIIKKQTFEVDGHRFNSEKEALAFIERKNNKGATDKHNAALLESDGRTFVPVYDPEEQSIDIFIKTKIENSGGWNWWKSLVKDRELRYYDEKLTVLTNDGFMGEFRKYPSIYIGTNEWNDFLRGITYLNENAKNPLDWREVVGLIGQMQVTPEYIYHD